MFNKALYELQLKKQEQKRQIELDLEGRRSNRSNDQGQNTLKSKMVGNFRKRISKFVRQVRYKLSC
jgi:hypothetical protein